MAAICLDLNILITKAKLAVQHQPIIWTNVGLMVNGQWKQNPMKFKSKYNSFHTTK